MTIRHINVKINILKPETDKKWTKISNLSTMVIKENLYLRVMITELLSLL